jgi:hypothetical protein
MKKLGDLHVTTSVLRLAVHDETPGLEREHLYAVASLFVLKRGSDVVRSSTFSFRDTVRNFEGSCEYPTPTILLRDSPPVYCQNGLGMKKPRNGLYALEYVKLLSER